MTSRTETFLDDVRAARAAIAAKYDYDVDRMFEAIKALEREHPERVFRRIKHVTYTLEPAYDVDTPSPDA